MTCSCNAGNAHEIDLNSDALALLKAIDIKLGRLLGDFDALPEKYKALYLATAIKNATIADIMQIESTPEMAAKRKSQEKEENRQLVEAAKRAGMKAKDFDLLELEAQVGQDSPRVKRALGL